MTERYKGYWVYGNTLSRPPNTHHWESLGSLLKDGRLGSVVEVVRIQDVGITFYLAGLAEFYGIENSRIFVEHCLPLSG